MASQSHTISHLLTPSHTTLRAWQRDVSGLKEEITEKAIVRRSGNLNMSDNLNMNDSASTASYFYFLHPASYNLQPASHYILPISHTPTAHSLDPAPDTLHLMHHTSHTAHRKPVEIVSG